MLRLLRQLVYGLVAGALLSLLRAPLGVDLVAAVAVDGSTAAFARATALLAFAIWLDPRRAAFRGGVSIGALLLGAGTGYALHGLLCFHLFQAESRLGLTLVLALGTVTLAVLAGRVGDPVEPADDDAPAPGFAERLGLALAAAGAAVGLDAVAGNVRLMTLSLPEDDTVLGVVVLGLLLVGATCFGRALIGKRHGPALAPALVALCVVGVGFGLGFVEGLHRAALDQYLRRFGLDLSLIGTLRCDALLAAGAFVLPVFAAGAALGAVRDATRLHALAAGAALGILAQPFVAVPYAVLAVAGATLALVVATASAPARVVGAGLTLAAFVFVLLGPEQGTPPLSPWYPTTIEPMLALRSDVGLVTVEGERDGARVVTVDRRRVSPTAHEEDVDARRIGYAWSLVSHERRGADGARVLFVGALTPARVAAFEAFGMPTGGGLERTAPWIDVLERVDAEMFDGARPPGVVVSPGEARSRIREGAYDLVLVLPTSGPVHLPRSASEIPWGAPPAPATAGWSVPDGTLAVVWIDAAAAVANRDLGERVLVAGVGPLSPCVGVVLGLDGAPPEGAAELLPIGPPARRASALTLLQEREIQRDDHQRAALMRRLADADGAYAALRDGLARCASIQSLSSPFETPAQRVELEEDVLRAFYDAALAAPPGPYLRNVWEVLAALLVDKRYVEELLTYVEPLAQRYGPWDALDRAVVRAYVEFGMSEEAAALLDGLALRNPLDLGLRAEAAHAWHEAGNPGAAAVHLRAALALQPNRRDLKRELAIVLVASGDPEGQELAQQLLLDAPDDAELRALLAPGPAPDDE